MQSKTNVYIKSKTYVYTKSLLKNNSKTSFIKNVIFF